LQAREPAAIAPAEHNQPQPDWCSYGASFDREDVDCPAFQRHPFVAATSYGKPLGTHIACAHLQVGEFERNQFYPRCALGSERERVLWMAKVGRGKIEAQRALQVEFEARNADFRRRLINAKAALLSAAPADVDLAREALAATVGDFLTSFDSFVGAHARRVAALGVSPATVTAIVTRLLAEWQYSARLDLPISDSTWLGRPGSLEPAPGDDLPSSVTTVKPRSVRES
jgi:hypothetical protein